MRNLLLFFIVTICGAATLPLYIDTDTNTVVSPDAPTTLDGYGITDAVSGTPTLDAFLVGDGAAWVTQSGQTAQESLGVVNVDGGAVIGASSSAVAGGAIGASSSAVDGGAVGYLAEAADGGAVGRNSSATNGGAIGRNAEATTGFAGGFLASAESGGAIGYLASADGPGRVQLGTGTNSTDSTIQFLNSGSVTAAEFGILSGADTDLTTLSLPANTTISTFGASLVDDSDAVSANITIGLVSSPGQTHVGVGSSASGTFGTAIGLDSSASGTLGVAIGYESVAAGSNSAQIGNGTNNTDNTIQFLSSGSVTAAEFGRLAVSTTAATGSTYTVLSTDHVILANNSGGVAVALISAASAGDGFRLVIKNTGTGAVTIDADGAETIDGALTAILTNQYESITIVSDGSNWFIL